MDFLKFENFFKGQKTLIFLIFGRNFWKFKGFFFSRIIFLGTKKTQTIIFYIFFHMPQTLQFQRICSQGQVNMYFLKILFIYFKKNFLKDDINNHGFLEKLLRKTKEHKVESLKHCFNGR